MIFVRAFVVSLCVMSLCVSMAAAEQTLKIKPRSGVTLKMLADNPGGAPGETRAIAVLFPGGSGKVNVKNDGTFKGTKGNFLTRSRKMFSGHGLVTVLFDAPSDHKDKEGLTFDYRMTEEHAGDIKLAMAKLRETFPGLPLWLVGTSRGTTSVGNAAANIKDGGPDGLVLTASVGTSSKHGGNVLDYDLASITMPVLVAHHQEDGCSLTPVSGAKDIKAALSGSKSAELMIFEGGSSGSGRECGAKSHHGFLGIEQKVVDAIAAWIKSH
ncbi:MAG: alpha/beta hydrolase [Alphaproteobacteria bacterium]|nr:alpha/beta hydrolase [Alphaproteobacteria bacterium]